ncbi:MAG: hypothetical protein RBT11_18460 [Desulfobacterales bacterium]|nr:hypothetical protein [Desulfobacterales bacterium]
MFPVNRLMPFVLTLVIAVLLQAAFIVLDCKQTPYQVAADFARAYFRLDPAMANYLCATQKPKQQTAIVADFIQRTTNETRQRGFDIGMAKSSLYELKTHTVQKSDTEADVHLTAHRRTAINPVFPIIAAFFKLGKVHEVHETIKVVKENGQWKVCSPVFDIVGS